MRTISRRPRSGRPRGLGRTSDRRLNLLDGVPVVLWQARPSSARRAFVSRHAEALFGYPIGRWKAEPSFWRDHIHPEDRRRTLAELSAHETHGGGEPLRLSYRFIAADGRVVWIKDLVAVQRDRAGRPLAVRGVMIDVSDFRRWRDLRADRPLPGLRRRPLVKRAPVRGPVARPSARR